MEKINLKIKKLLGDNIGEFSDGYHSSVKYRKIF